MNFFTRKRSVSAIEKEIEAKNELRDDYLRQINPNINNDEHTRLTGLIRGVDIQLQQLRRDLEQARLREGAVTSEGGKNS